MVVRFHIFLNSAIVPLISKHFVLLIKKNDREEDKDIYNLRRERNNARITARTAQPMVGQFFFLETGPY